MTWLNYDLHMHGNKSAKTKSGDKDKVKAMTAKEFCDIALINKIDCFSITDHNTLDSQLYSELIALISTDASYSTLKIIPGVEFDVYIDNDPKKYFQALIYFKTDKFLEIEMTVDSLYSKLAKPKLGDILSEIGKLGCRYLVVPEGNKSHGITSILKSISPSHNRMLETMAMLKMFGGFDTNGFTHQIQNLWATNFYKRTEEFSSYVTKKTDDEIKQLIDKLNKTIKGDTTFLDDVDVKTCMPTISSYSYFFAYLDFSDWHNALPYTHKRFNYIFSNPQLPFESFEMALIDPGSRLRVTDCPEITVDNNYIQEISFDISGKKKAVKFTPGLNVVVGKRGSGKSLLHSIICKLHDKDDQMMSKYTSLKIANLKCRQFNGITIEPGSLSSISILKQEEISKIFDDPTKIAGDSILSDFFPNPELPQFTSLSDLLIKVKLLAPYDTNYKSVTAHLGNLEGATSYNINCKPDKPVESELRTKLDQFDRSYSDLSSYLAKYGVSHVQMDSLFSSIKQQIDIAKQKISLTSQFLNSIEFSIKEYNSELGEVAALYKSSNIAINEIFGNIKSILRQHLIFKQVIYLLDNLTLEVPTPKVKIFEKYAFIVKPIYARDRNAKNDVLECLQNSIKGGTSYNSVEVLLTKYMNGDLKLKATVQSLHKNLEQYYDSLIDEDTNEKFEFLIFELMDPTISLKENDLVSRLSELEESGQIKNISNSSLGTKTVAYLDLLFSQPDSIVLFDQPEDNIDNDYIGNHLVELIREQKKNKQLIFVTHNPSLAVYGDAYNYIFATNDGEIEYRNHEIYTVEDKNQMLKILEGGRQSFSNRNLKYGNVIGALEIEN